MTGLDNSGSHVFYFLEGAAVGASIGIVEPVIELDSVHTISFLLNNAFFKVKQCEI
jgi:hypothetical protein